MKRLCLVLLSAGALTGCVRYEYEEEMVLKTDGSGQVTLHGSRELFAALGSVVGTPDPNLVTRESLRQAYEAAGVDVLEVLSVKRSRRDGRTFFHVRARFRDIQALTRHPAFRGHRYELERLESALALRAEVEGGERVRGVAGIPRDGLVAFRVHFPSPVRSHNSASGLDRGNIVAWEQSVGDHLRSEPLRIEAHFDQRTVLEATLIVVGSALVLVAAALTLALYLTVRLGRRQLRTDRALRLESGGSR